MEPQETEKLLHCKGHNHLDKGAAYRMGKGFLAILHFLQLRREKCTVCVFISCMTFIFRQYWRKVWNTCTQVHTVCRNDSVVKISHYCFRGPELIPSSHIGWSKSSWNSCVRGFSVHFWCVGICTHMFIYPHTDTHGNIIESRSFLKRK